MKIDRLLVGFSLVFLLSCQGKTQDSSAETNIQSSHIGKDIQTWRSPPEQYRTTKSTASYSLHLKNITNRHIGNIEVTEFYEGFEVQHPYPDGAQVKHDRIVWQSLSLSPGEERALEINVRRTKSTTWRQTTTRWGENEFPRSMQTKTQDGLIIRRDPLPDILSPDHEYTYGLWVENMNPNSMTFDLRQDVVGLEIISTQPDGAMRLDGGVEWSRISLNGGEKRRFEITGRTLRGLNFEICERISLCAQVVIGEAEIKIGNPCIDKADMCFEITVNIPVTNVGNISAENVNLTTMLPKQLSSLSGEKSIQKFMGSIEPGATRIVPIQLKADNRGTYDIDTLVDDGKVDSSIRDQRTIRFDVRGPELVVDITEPPTTTVGQEVNFKISVINRGDSPAHDVVVYDNFSSDRMTVSRASGEYDQEQEKIEWRIPVLASGEQREFNVTMRGHKICSVETSAGAYNKCVQSAEARANIRFSGRAGIGLEVVDLQDALLVGENVTYTIEVSNEGTINLTNVNVRFEMPQGLELKSVSGGVALLNGRSNFEGVPILRPGETLKLQVHARSQTPGKKIFKVLVSSDQIEEFSEEEPTLIEQ